MTPQEYLASKAQATIEPKMVAVDAANPDALTADTDAVLVTTPRFCPCTGKQLGVNTIEFSKEGMRKDIANAKAALQAMKDMLADLEAA